ncbi:unnamed protein product [Cutaneotrichosporon oleaginosum]
MTFETEPLLGPGFVRRAEEVESERRNSTASATSTHSRTWGWRDDDPVPAPAPEPVHDTVGATTVAKKPKGLAALVKRFNDIGRDRRRHEREWARPPVFGTVYGFC